MAAGDPIGADLCSGTTDGSTLPELDTFEEREISLGAGYALESGRKYAIVLRNSASASGTAITISGQLFPNAAYANGYYADSNDAGSSWSQDDWIDVWFKTKAATVEKDTYTDTGWQDRNVYGNNWYCMVFQASSAYTIDAVVLRLSSEVGGTPGTITVSIRNVQGEETLPTKATTPAPADAATNVTLDQATLTWADGGDTDTYNIYYGTESGSLLLISSGVALGSESFTVTGITDGSPYDYITTRYWRIDSVNDDGTTEGDEWSFTTIRLDPPSETYWYSTGGYYYRLLPQSDGTYGDPPPTGTENIDYEVLAGYLPNFINTNRRLIAAARNSIYYEDI